MRIELLRIEFAEAVPGEACGIIHEQAHGREPGRGREDRVRTGWIGQVRDSFDRSRWNIVGVMVDVSHNRPTVAEKRASDLPAHALGGAGDDCSCVPVSHWESPALSRTTKQSNGRTMPESRPPIELQGVSLAELRTLIGQRRLPPVEQWNPERCGHSGMRIARDGTWYHDGSPIGRPAMVRLFSSILRREPDGSHVLVTPAEKLEIHVETTPFRAVEMLSEGKGRDRRIAFRLDSGDAVILGSEHPLRVVEDPRGPSPRILVRHGLEAELTRSVYYELAEIALAEGHQPPGIWSDGTFFHLGGA